MDETLHPALLPAGLRDLLPPDARIEAALVERLMTTLGRHGFERVKPPMLEFESSLLSGSGAAMAPETFRLMDPISQRMIGVRADMTLQIARIATNRLIKSPRPLRLSYAGQVLRVRGSQLRPERQFGQVGAELIGADGATADAEVISLAVEALLAEGVQGLSVDLTVPGLVPLLLDMLGVAGDTAQALRAALDHKDAAGLQAIGGAAAPLLGQLMAAAGPAERAFERIAAIALPERAAAEITRLREIALLVQDSEASVSLTIDPIENRGFEYHTGVSFSLFAPGIRNELGRGGRYLAGSGEPATGFTVYTDTVIHAVPKPAAERRVFLPFGTVRATGAGLRAEGWITVAALGPGEAVPEARRLGCSHLLIDGAAREL